MRKLVKTWLLAMVLLFGLCGGIALDANAAEKLDVHNPMPAKLIISGFMSEHPEQELQATESINTTGTYGESQTYFLLPAAADSREVKLTFWSVYYTTDGTANYTEETGYVQIDNTKVWSGDTITLPKDRDLNIVASNGTFKVQILQSKNLASIHITTKDKNMDAVDKSADKSVKAKGDILVMNPDGTVNYEGALKQIKGRGNATWTLPKKPYNFKLEKSADLLDMGKSKNWCLLANYLDSSLMRNKIAYTLADEVGISYNMAEESVDLYTDGSYRGTYQLTEKVDIEENRVDIVDLGKATEKVNLDKNGEELDLEDDFTAGGTKGYVAGTQKWQNIPNNPEDITGGYLLEIELDERYAKEACGFVTTSGQAVVMKAPEFISEAQVKYIAAFYQEMEDALYSKNGYNSKGKHFSEYIDETSIAKMYLLQEFTMNLDTGITSFYLIKDSDLVGDGKLHMAVAWDFDNSIGNHSSRDGVNLTDPTQWWANRALCYESSRKDRFNVLAQAVQHESVKKEIVYQWNEVFYPAIKLLLGQETNYVPKYLEKISEYKEQLAASAAMNFVAWPDMLWHTDLGTQTGSDFETSVKYVDSFLTRRTVFMNNAFAYGNTSGYERITGTVTVEGEAKVGNTLTAKVEDKFETKM